MESIIGKVFKHFKGNYYLVEDVALDANTKKEVVVYRALYDDNKLWVRDKEEFLGIHKSGVKRFEEVVLPNKVSNT